MDLADKFEKILFFICQIMCIDLVCRSEKIQFGEIGNRLYRFPLIENYILCLNKALIEKRKYI